MDADPKFDALVGRDLGVAFDHRSLEFNGAVHCVDDAAELDDRAVPSALDDVAVMHRNSRVDQVAPKGPEPRQNPVLVGSGKPRIADHVGHQDRGQFSGLAHGATPPRPCQPFRVVRARPLGGIAKTREECRCSAWAWLHIHAALGRTWKQGVQVLRVDWPVYPRRAEHNTVAEGGNRRWAETGRHNAFQSRSIDADLAKRVRAYLAEHPAVSWIEAVEAIAGRAS